MQTQATPESSPNASPAVLSDGQAQDAPVSPDNANTEAPAAVPPHNEDPVDNPLPAEAEVEAKPEVDPEAEARQKEEDFSRRFAALTRKEREFLNRERTVKDREAQLADAEAKLKNLKDNPMEALKAAGWSFKELAEFVVNNEQLPESKKQQSTFEQLQSEIRELKEKLNAREEQELTQQQQANVDAFKANIRKEVEGNLDKYALISDFGDEAIEMVYDVIENHFNNTFDPDLNQGEILDIHKAASAVEEHLAHQAERFFKSNKFADRLRPQEPETPPESTAASQAKPQPSPTLTHRQTASAPTPKTEGEHFMSDEESKAAAAKFLQEQLSGSGARP